MEEDAFNTELLDNGTFGDGSLSPEDQADEILSRFPLESGVYDSMKQILAKLLRSNSELGNQFAELRSKHHDTSLALHDTEKELKEARDLQEAQASRLMEMEESSEKMKEVNNTTIRELNTLKSQIQVEEKLRTHSNSLHGKRYSNYMKRTGTQPLYGINHDDPPEEQETAASTERSEVVTSLDEELLDIRQPSLSAEQEEYFDTLRNKYVRTVEENKNLKEQIKQNKEEYVHLESDYTQLQHYKQDLQKQVKDKLKELDQNTRRKQYLEQRFKYMKDGNDKKTKEIMQLRAELKKMKTTQTYENNIRRSTILLEEQMKERLGLELSQHNRSASTKVVPNLSMDTPEGGLSTSLRRGPREDSTESKTSSATSNSNPDVSFNPPPVAINSTFSSSFETPNILVQHTRNTTNASLAYQMDGIAQESDEESRSGGGLSVRMPRKSSMSEGDLQSQQGGGGGLMDFNLGTQLYQNSSVAPSKPASDGGDMPATRDEQRRATMYVKLAPVGDLEVNDTDKRSYFMLTVLFCKSQYKDFDVFATVDPSELFQIAEAEQVLPIEYLHFVKEKVRFAYRKGKLESRNIEPEQFQYRMWTLADIDRNEYLEAPELRNSFFYSRAKLAQEKEEEERAERERAEKERIRLERAALAEQDDQESKDGSDCTRLLTKDQRQALKAQNIVDTGLPELQPQFISVSPEHSEGQDRDRVLEVKLEATSQAGSVVGSEKSMGGLQASDGGAGGGGAALQESSDSDNN